MVTIALSVKGNAKSIVQYLLISTVSFTRDLARVNILPGFPGNSRVLAFPRKICGCYSPGKSSAHFEISFILLQIFLQIITGRLVCALTVTIFFLVGAAQSGALFLVTNANYFRTSTKQAV